jgi:demethylmenaquinone methyltransferase/2-methoxy-6-polyprenyl-1,4-benzoquinol methylase
LDNGERVSRVARPRREAGATYDWLSKWYDLLAGRWEKPFQDAGLQKLAVRGGERVLEIGFGTGHTLADLARSAGLRGQVWGVDISRDMGEVAGERVREAGLSRRVNLIRGDAVDLPLKEDAFDALFMAFTLELFDTPDIPAVLRECRRVLREDGRMCVVSLAKRKEPSLVARLYEWAHVRFPAVLDCRPIYVGKALDEAGFRIVNIERGTMAGLGVDVLVADRPASAGKDPLSSNGLVVVDGANVAYAELSEDGEPRVANLIAVRRALEKRGYDSIIIVDASLRHHVDDPAWLERLIESQAVRQAPAGTDADYFVLETADRLEALVVSNDTFDRFQDRYPLFVQFTADNPQDLVIPIEAGATGSAVTFGMLERAQAEGDRKALVDAGRRVVHFHLGENVVDGLERLKDTES